LFRKRRHANSTTRNLPQNAVWVIVILFLVGLVGFYSFLAGEDDQDENDPFQTLNETKQIDPNSGLVIDEELPLIIGNCTSCHSASLIAQNKSSREGWAEMIKWMQETQNLWDLGINESKILDYLERHYSPQKKGRRQPLTDIEWYILDDKS